MENVLQLTKGLTEELDIQKELGLNGCHFLYRIKGHYKFSKGNTIYRYHSETGLCYVYTMDTNITIE